MQWIGWLVAALAVAVAAWLWLKLAGERAHAAQLLYARIDAENQVEALRASESRMHDAARLAALGGVLSHALPQLHLPLEGIRAGADEARAELADYRLRVQRYDEAVQYCLQPVELIFGADKASLDELVKHVEGARRKLFEARSALAKSPLHAGSALADARADDLVALSGLARSLHELARPAPSALLDVNASLDAALGVLVPRFGERIAIARDYHPVPSLRGADPRLREAFLHVLDNAARAAGAGGRLSLVTRTDTARAHVEIVIGDSGAGIDEDALAHVLEPFFTTRADEGAAGLGLAVARQLVAERGGDIAVRSSRGLGTTVTLNLPVDPPAGAHPAP